jgi:hypothetical protein
MLSFVGIWRGLRASSVSITISSALYPKRSVHRSARGESVWKKWMDGWELTHDEILDIPRIVDTPFQLCALAGIVDADL